MLRRFTLSFIALFAAFQLAQAQRHELGIQAGLSSFVGDIGRTNYIFQKPIIDGYLGFPASVNVIYRMNFNPYQTLRFNIGYTGVQFSDRYAKENYRRYRRDWLGYSLEGTNSVYNADVQFEYNFFPVNNEQKSLLSPYIFGGIGGVLYSKEQMVIDFSNYNFVDANGDGVIDVFPTYTSDYEDQVITSTTSTAAFSIPFGAGLKYKFNYNWAIFGEFKFRYIFADNVDYSSVKNNDVNILYDESALGRELSDYELNAIAEPYISDRKVGNPNSNDWVNTFTLGISYSFGRPPCYCE